MSDTLFDSSTITLSTNKVDHSFHSLHSILYFNTLEPRMMDTIRDDDQYQSRYRPILIEISININRDIDR
ncbi:hypothetical protein AAMO2058_001703500, partial [Amorphochlora amoebiformis]